MMGAHMRFASLVAVMLVASTSTLTADLQAQVVVGNCNVVINSKNLSDGKISVGDIGCPQDPQKVLRISYHWLDSASFSFLLAGMFEGQLRELLGDRPFVLPNDALRLASDLVANYGVNIDDSSFPRGFYQTCVNGPCKYDSDKVQRSENIAPQLRRRLRVYEANARIFLPDADAATTVYSTLRWPSNYKLYYTGFNDADGPFPGLVWWRSIAREELQNYRQLALSFRDRALGSPGIAHFPIEVVGRLGAPTRQDYERIGKLDPTVREKETHLAQIRVVPNLARSPSLAAMLDYTKGGWPEDFLLALGFMDWEHGGMDAASWSVFVPPRVPYLQIAVIENIGNSASVFELVGFSVARSQRADLRHPKDNGPEVSEQIPFPPKSLGRGDRVVIPLAIELRNTFEVAPWSSGGVSLAPSVSKTGLARQWLSRKAPTDTVRLTSSDWPRLEIRKQVSAFAPIELPRITPAYLYGPKYRLTHALVDGTAIPLRQFDSNRIYMVSGYESGTCPVLYVRRAADVDAVKVGPVIRQAVGPKGELSETIDIGTDVSSLYIAEEELERTLIRKLQVYLIDEEGRKEIVASTLEPVVLDFGQRLEVNIPAAKRKSTARYYVELIGYYEPYSTTLGSRTALKRKAD